MRTRAALECFHKKGGHDDRFHLLAVALTVDAGSEVLIADPSYPTNRELVRAFEGVVVDVGSTSARSR